MKNDEFRGCPDCPYVENGAWKGEGKKKEFTGTCGVDRISGFLTWHGCRPELIPTESNQWKLRLNEEQRQSGLTLLATNA